MTSHRRSYVPHSPTRLANSSVILPFAAALIAGTGGSYGSCNIPLYQKLAVKPLVKVVEPTETTSRVNTLATADLLVQVKKSFALTMSQTARVFGVTRQTIYDWTEGTQPRAESLNKLWRLYSLIEAIPASVKFERNCITRPVLDGKSLLEILESDGPIEEALKLLSSGPGPTNTRVGVRRLSRRHPRFTLDQVTRSIE